MATLKEVMDDVRNFINNSVSDLAIDLTEEIRANTPVRTGFCQSNWVPTVGSPYKGLAGQKISKDEARIDNGPYNAGMRALEKYKTSDGTIYLTNNVDYVQVLEEGSSSQAPMGFVKTGIDLSIQGMKYKL